MGVNTLFNEHGENPMQDYVRIHNDLKDKMKKLYVEGYTRIDLLNKLCETFPGVKSDQRFMKIAFIASEDVLLEKTGGVSSEGFSW